MILYIWDERPGIEASYHFAKVRPSSVPALSARCRGSRSLY